MRRKVLWLLLSHLTVAAAAWVVGAGQAKPQHPQKERASEPDDYRGDAYVHFPAAFKEPRLRLRVARVAIDGRHQDFGTGVSEVESLYRVELADGRVVVWGELVPLPKDHPRD